MTLSAQHITIFGTGLIGGSIGLALRAAGWQGQITGFDRDADAAQRALARGCLHKTTPDLAAAASKADLIILATPAAAFQDLLVLLAPSVSSTATITDVASTKQNVFIAAAKAFAKSPAVGARFIPAHPMAGSERSGPDAASSKLFRDKPCILTPAPDADPASIALVESLWTTLGMRIIRMTPTEHDQAVAQVSHLPQALASLLVLLASRHDALDLASTGFRDTTRLASSDPNLWADIFLANRTALLESLHGFIDELSDLRKALADGDRKHLHAILSSAQSARKTWRDKQKSEERSSE